MQEQIILKHIKNTLTAHYNHAPFLPTILQAIHAARCYHGESGDRSPRAAAIARTSPRPNAFQNRRFHTISCPPPPPTVEDHVSPGAVTAPSSRSCGAVIQHDSAPVHLTDVTDYPEESPRKNCLMNHFMALLANEDS